MRTDHPPLYDNTLTGVLARLTHGILLDANRRAQLDRAKRDYAPDGPSASSLGSSFANSVAKTRSWLQPRRHLVLEAGNEKARGVSRPVGGHLRPRAPHAHAGAQRQLAHRA